MSFSKGKTVRLKSGGPVMTIAGRATPTGRELRCVWFDKAQQKEGRFLPELLEEVKESRPEPRP